MGIEPGNLERVLELQPDNKDAARELRSLKGAFAALRKKEQRKFAGLFDRMQAQRITPTAQTCHSVITAYGQGYQWRNALSFVERMHVLGAEKGDFDQVFVYTAAVSACEKSGRSREALAQGTEEAGHRAPPPPLGNAAFGVGPVLL